MRAGTDIVDVPRLRAALERRPEPLPDAVVGAAPGCWRCGVAATFCLAGVLRCMPNDFPLPMRLASAWSTAKPKQRKRANRLIRIRFMVNP